ncbi:cyclin-T1 isoform X2 [Chironomus tepperi]|uniref:cyclin-T1 isoform X2 n=1 Tax=Chironomus tepperi TaxID=113505 RepID=UPI00391F90F1
MSDPRWYFTEEQLANSPSRKCGINAELELSYRQRAANLIQEMGQRLQVSQLCINTAIVYMHRFYAFHSFTMFHRNSIAAASFFLAAKVEEQPRKLEHVIKILNICLEKNDMNRDSYAEQAQELVLNENILLQTLGFDVAIDHPHTHVVKACQLFNIVTVSRELRQTCYFMASNSLHLTTMCLKYRPTVVAAFCIYIACKWSRWEIPDSSEGKAWYSYVDDTVTLDTLKQLTEEYLQILERSPSKFKSKMKAITSNGQAAVNQSPSVTDGPSTSHHKNNQHHDKHHHHHHHKNASMSSSSAGAASSSMNVNANGNSRSSSSSSSAKAQMHQMPNSSSSSSSSSSSQYKQVPSSQSGMNSSSSIQPPLPPTASSNHNMHRQRPSSSSSQSQPYASSNSNQPKPPLMDERSHQQQQRLVHQDGSFYNSSSSSSQRMSDHSKHRNMTSSNSAPPPPPPQQNPPLPPSQQQQQQPYMKLNSMNDQKQHNMMVNNSKQAPPYPGQNMDMHQKNIKQSSADYHNRNNPQLNQQIPNNPQKKPTWPQQQSSSSSMSQQQQQQQQQLQTSHNQDKQYPHLQKNLQQIPNSANILDQSASNLLNTSSSKSSAYNEMSSNSSKQQQQQQQQQQQNLSQNDFWFSDKINEMSNKTMTPPRGQSLFSPSPEHDNNEKAKYMMMTGSLKRSNDSAVDSPKEEKKSTPTKRDKSILGNQSGSNQKQLNPPLPTSNQMDSKKFSKIDNVNASVPQLSSADQMMMDAQIKKRSYSSIKDSLDTTHNRENKIRKVDPVKGESNAPSSLPATPSQSSKAPSQSLSQPPSIYGGVKLDMPMPVPTKQPLETNPDVVKSLLAECFSSNNKFDLYDSPLDIMNPELPDELFATTPTSSVPSKSQQKINQPQSTQIMPQQQQQQQQQTSMNMTKHESLDDLLDIKDDKMDSSAGESSRKDKKKSKKKKEKHKHKKKHKSSDREDNKSDSSSLKIIFSKESKADTKSSPESYGGGLKIKIPINKDAGKIEVNQSQSSQPAPIKLKISKEKFGSFTNLNNNNNNNNNSSSSSSSSHHHHKSKKDKDKDKEKDREKSKSKSSKHYNSSDYKESSSYQHSN